MAATTMLLSDALKNAADGETKNLGYLATERFDSLKKRDLFNKAALIMEDVEALMRVGIARDDALLIAVMLAARGRNENP